MNENKLRPQDLKLFKNFEKWLNFLNSKVEFNDTSSIFHTKKHCSRVLFYVLLLAQLKGLNEKDTQALAMAACFHDSRRENDLKDTGHGKRAAEYYRTYCNDHNLEFDDRTYQIIKNHDLDDEIGIMNLKKESSDSNAILLYQIFKDADALDRYRLGNNGLNLKFLRNKEALKLAPIVKDVFFN